MKLRHFKGSLVAMTMLLCSFTTVAGKGPDSCDSLCHDQNKHMERYMNFWNALIPRGARLQYAGNMGALSAGPVWTYGRNRQWETALQLGFIPRHGNGRTMACLTIKQDFVPWRLPLGSGNFSLAPLATGLYVNTVIDSRFWVAQPGRYPKGYYWFATRLRPNVYVGQRLVYLIPSGHGFLTRQVSAFYEISTNDFSIIQAAHNSSFSLNRLLTISFGLQFTWL